MGVGACTPRAVAMKRPTKRAQQFRFRNRMLRGAIWVFLIAFILTSVGIAIITSTAHR
jgi:hypothetical protein